MLANSTIYQLNTNIIKLLTINIPPKYDFKFSKYSIKKYWY